MNEHETTGAGLEPPPVPEDAGTTAAASTATAAVPVVEVAGAAEGVAAVGAAEAVIEEEDPNRARYEELRAAQLERGVGGNPVPLVNAPACPLCGGGTFQAPKPAADAEDQTQPWLCLDRRCRAEQFRAANPDPEPTEDADTAGGPTS